MDLDAILARSQNPGQFVERQSFTLSRSKALSKMRDFTLRSPNQFGLELIQAGVFAGANWVFVDADKHQATVGWVGGRSLKRRELEQLLDYLFVSEGASSDRHLRQLAVAVNVLVRRRPLVLRVESGDAEGSVRLDMDGSGNGTLGIPEERIFGTYLHVRFSEPWFWETTSRSPVADLVETECIYSPVPVFVNGTGPHGWDRHLPLSNPMTQEEVSFRNEHRDGWIGYPIAMPGYRVPARVKVVVGGVIVSRRAIPELGKGIEGVIRDDNLAKTADMSDVVADEHWNRMLHHLVPVVAPLHERRHGSWEAPELEPLEAEREEDDDVPAVEVRPLSDGLTVLGLTRPHLSTQHAMLAEEPLFWVTPEDGYVLADRLAPERFPGRVVVVGEAQREAFAALLQATGARANRIQPDDAAFVVDQLAKGSEIVEATAATDIGLLHLRLHRRGAMPGWRMQPGGLPLLLLHADGHREVHTLVLDLPQVSAVLDLDADLDVADHVKDLAHTIEREVWRLALETREPALVRELLGQAVWLQPTGSDGHEIRLPSTWPEEAGALLDLPLVLDGPTARELLGTLGTDEAVRVDGHWPELLTFMEPFGPGHVDHTRLPARSLYVLQWEDGAWLQRSHLRPRNASAVYGLQSRFGATPRLPSGWHPVPTPHPLVFAAQRDDAEGIDWDVATERFRSTVLGGLGGPLDPADEAVVRLARIALADEDVRLETTEGASVGLAAVRAGDVRVCLRGGPGSTDPGVLLLTVDEVRSIGGNLRWSFDDPPELWSPEPHPDEWLVTTEVVEDGLVGWIGLRHPYDPTAGVLLQRGLRTEVVSGIAQGARFHGWLRQTHTGDALPALQAATTRVLELLCEDFPEDLETTARAYRADFAAIVRLHPECGFDAALGRRLASRVPIADWGDLAGWLRAPRDHRPDLPLTIRGLWGQRIDPDAQLETGSTGSVLLDAMRLVLAQEGPSTATSLYINPDNTVTTVWETGKIAIAFPGRSPAVRLGDRGEPRALTLALLEGVRQLYRFDRRTGVGELDLLALQRSALQAVRTVTGRR